MEWIVYMLVTAAQYIMQSIHNFLRLWHFVLKNVSLKIRYKYCPQQCTSKILEYWITGRNSGCEQRLLACCDFQLEGRSLRPLPACYLGLADRDWERDKPRNCADVNVHTSKKPWPGFNNFLVLFLLSWLCCWSIKKEIEVDDFSVCHIILTLHLSNHLVPPADGMSPVGQYTLSKDRCGTLVL